MTQDINMTTDGAAIGSPEHAAPPAPAATEPVATGSCASAGAQNGWRPGISTFTTAPLRQWPIST